MKSKVIFDTKKISAEINKIAQTEINKINREIKKQKAEGSDMAISTMGEKFLIDVIKLEKSSDGTIFITDELTEKYQLDLNMIIEELENATLAQLVRQYVDGATCIRLYPRAYEYFETKNKREEEKKASQVFNVTNSNFVYGIAINSSMTIDNSVSFLEKQIQEKGGEDKQELTDLLAEVKEVVENMQATKQIPKNSSLMKRLSNHLEKHGWFYGAVVQLLGTCAMTIMGGGA